MSATSESWTGANQRYLSAALGRLRLRLAQPGLDSSAVADARQELAAAHAAMPAPPALETLCRTFGLSPFECDLLLLCAGVEIDPAFAALCAAAQGEPSKPYATFSLALERLADADWSALNPAAPLRRWRLLEVGPGNAVTASPLRIDERVLHYLCGVQYLDERLVGFVRPVPPPDDLPPSQQALAEQLAATWAQADPGALPAAQLCGEDAAALSAVASAACARLGLGLYALPALAVPHEPREQEALVRLWEREGALTGSALLVECGELDTSDPLREGALTRLIDGLGGPLIVAGRERRLLAHRLMVTFEVRPPTTDEQRSLWLGSLGSAAAGLDGGLEALVGQFSLSVPAIRAACAQAFGHMAAGDGSSSADQADLGATLWEACRVQARPRLENLAQRIEPAANWDDLVLPQAQKQLLREIAVHVRQRQRVYHAWGFAAKNTRGLGISALFAGASGTGKTMAAEVLAGELRLDLFRIDLSQVVSKYIGETEKNLRRVFDAAEGGGAILLFDEADALFGKRSEVKDSHDRYANIEISYLLQRMESYRGLAIMTTNMKEALDQAFLRRIRFVVQFPFPDAAQRAEIWRRIFPAATPIASIDAGKLARLNVAGGNIRNIALYAAFLAAEVGEPVRMAHLLRAARVEYAKLERPLSEAEIGGWA